MNFDEDSSDGMDELHDIIAEYEAKEQQKETAAEIKDEDDNKKKVSADTNDDVAIEKGAQKKKKKKKRKKTIKSATSEHTEVPMDKLLFGDKAGLIKRLAKAANATVGNEDKTAGQSKDEDDNASAEKRGIKRPAWTDADDDVVVGDVISFNRGGEYTAHIRKDKPYKEYLTAKFARLQPQPKWASLEKPKTDDSDDDELLRTVGFIAKPREGVLVPNQIQYKKLKDLNRATYAEGNITSIEFHPTSTAALVAGDSCVVSIYSIDGRQNEKLHNMSFQGFPIKCARIMPCGTKAIFGSVRRFYYMYDLLTAKEQRYRLPKHITAMQQFELSPCGRYMAVVGRFGELHLFHAQSHELIHTFKQEDTVAGLCFTSNSQQIVCNSKSNTVSIFSLRNQRLEHSFIDDGCISGRTIDLSPNQRMLATGSREGVVNIYDFDKVKNLKAPQPEKMFLNLTTAISHVKFNHSSELLAFCSSLVPNGVKIAHFPSGTVYANFPFFDSNLGKVRNVSFSPNSGYLALGMYKKAPLFRLKHFKNY